MKLTSKTTTQEGMLDQEYRHIQTKWKIQMDVQDDFQGNEKLWDKFRVVEVEQRQYINTLDKYTWIKATRTNTFSSDTTNKDKKKVVEMVNAFLLATDEPLIHPYEDVLSYEYQEEMKRQEEHRQKLYNTFIQQNP